MTTREASEALGINEGMLRMWRKEYKEGKIQAFPGNGRMSDKDVGTVKYIRKTPSFLPGERFYTSGVVYSTNVR